MAAWKEVIFFRPVRPFNGCGWPLGSESLRLRVLQEDGASFHPSHSAMKTRLLLVASISASILCSCAERSENQSDREASSSASRDPLDRLENTLEREADRWDRIEDRWDRRF